ncbi:hypothetical protein DPMN_169786 [Dreissena polymorpha]|uniref:Uncharacterized protein n=1 Tax=Dreissena polymorpha TaxID=45954 RepID=A0A9D4DVW5_DREPO|nr:hypothetical protein DPMN_169786 [Dreissena polymorpha]
MRESADSSQLLREPHRTFDRSPRGIGRKTATSFPHMSRLSGSKAWKPCPTERL